MVEETQFRRPIGSYPGIYGEYSMNSEVVSDLANYIVNDQILVLRIADQPPYGFMFRVDNADLIEKVWRAKGRVDSLGNVDFSKKPVTSLSDKQLGEYTDWIRLRHFGYKTKDVMEVLKLGVHTVLPVKDSFPKQLITPSKYGPTLSAMRFHENSAFYDLVKEVYSLDSSAIVGGTSFNPENRPAYLNSQKLLEDLGGANSIVDFVVLSENSDSPYALQHAMIAFTVDGMKFVRRGIGYKGAVNKMRDMNIFFYE